MNDDARTNFSFRRTLRWVLVVLAGGFFVAEFRSCGYGPYLWEVSSVDLSPDGKSVVVGVFRSQKAPWESAPRLLMSGMQQTVKLLNTTNGAVFKTVFQKSYSGTRNPNRPKAWVKFSPDGENLAIGLWDSRVLMWNIQEQSSTSLESPSDVRFAHNLEFSSNGKRLAVLHRSVAVTWNIENLEKPELLSDWNDNRIKSGMLGSPSSLAFSPDGQNVVYGSEHGRPTILEADTGYLVKRIQNKDDIRKKTKKQDGSFGERPNSYTYQFVDYSPNGETLAMSGYARSSSDKKENIHVKLINTRTGKVEAIFDDLYGKVRYSPDGKMLAIAGYKKLTMIDTATNRILFENSSIKEIYAIAFSSDSKKLAVGRGNGKAALLDSENGNVIWQTDLVGIQKYFIIPKWAIAFILLYLAYRVGVDKNATDRSQQVEYELA